MAKSWASFFIRLRVFLLFSFRLLVVFAITHRILYIAPYQSSMHFRFDQKMSNVSKPSGATFSC